MDEKEKSKYSTITPYAYTYDPYYGKYNKYDFTSYGYGFGTDKFEAKLSEIDWFTKKLQTQLNSYEVLLQDWYIACKYEPEHKEKISKQLQHQRNYILELMVDISAWATKL